VCGFASVHFVGKITRLAPGDDGNLVWLALGAGFIYAAMLFDALDGYAARLSKTASDFGGQLDSLCDAVSFGLAPAFLLLRLCQDWDVTPFRQAVPVIAALYMVCALLRLARFNLENTPDPAGVKRFKGLPSPAAAGCLASVALLRSGPVTNAPFDDTLVQVFVKYFAPLGALAAALLMVSRLSYPHFTKQLLRGRRHFRFVVQAVLLVFVIALQPNLALFALFWAYALSPPIRHLINRAFHRPALAPRLDDGVPRLH
jgi:CDP-diacylglycerol--serine O-phosphatidyltransferase